MSCLGSREKRASVNNGGDMRIGRWRRFSVEALIGASVVALVFAGIAATADPILAAIALVGIAVMLELHVTAQPADDMGPQPLRPRAEPESAQPVPRAMAGFDAPIADATSV